MIFYQCSFPDGTKQLAPTQAEAKALDRNFIQVDVPTDKQGLMNYVNVLLSVIKPDRAPPIIPMEPAPPPPPPPPPAPEPVSDDTPVFSPTVLQSQVELLGENPNRGFDQLEEFQEIQGVGAAFSRGVHLLNIIAAGEQQLARVFLKRKKK